jgi:hypothetical protein
MFAC